MAADRRLLLAAGLVLAACSRAEPVNVLLISIDSLRADHLGVYGHRPEYAPEIPVSPNLDALAAEGTVFDSAWSSSSWTLPAHAALFTGLPDRAHGVEAEEYALAPPRRTLAEAFRAAGYATAGVYSGPFLDPRYGFERGFDEYRSAMTPREELETRVGDWNRRREARGLPPLDAAARRAILARAPLWDVTSPRVAELAADFLVRNRDRPFFLFLHFFDAHYDYLPELAEPGLGRRFDPDYRGAYGGENWIFDDRVLDPATGRRRIGERDLHHVQSQYDAEIHWVDGNIGRVFARLRDLGLWERTVICVVADHGDEFFEHGGVGHGRTLHGEVTRVPFLLRAPGRVFPGSREPAAVGLVDVAPTLLACADLPPLPEAAGRSLLSLLAGAAEDGGGVLQRLVARLGREGRPRILDGWRDERWAVIRELHPAGQDGEGRVRCEAGPAATWRVYDLRHDPAEQEPLAAGAPGRETALAAFCAAWGEGEAAWRRLAPPRTPAPAAAAAEPWDQAALGYAEAGLEEGGALRFLAPFPDPCER